MTVKQLIDALLEQPFSNTVYVSGIDPLTGDTEWDGGLTGLESGGPGRTVTRLQFNETGLNSHIDATTV